MFAGEDAIVILSSPREYTVLYNLTRVIYPLGRAMSSVLKIGMVYFIDDSIELAIIVPAGP